MLASKRAKRIITGRMQHRNTAELSACFEGWTQLRATALEAAVQSHQRRTAIAALRAWGLALAQRRAKYEAVQQGTRRIARVR